MPERPAAGKRAAVELPAWARWGTAADELLDACRPYAAALECLPELTATTALLAERGDERQRKLAARDGLTALPAWLADRYAPVRHTAHAA